MYYDIIAFMASGKRLTKNQLKARTVHEFNRTHMLSPQPLNNYDLKYLKYDYDSNVHALNSLDKLPNMLSVESMESLFSLYERITDDIMNMNIVAAMKWTKKAFLLNSLNAFIKDMSKTHAGISRILRSGEPFGMFIAYMVNDNINASIDCIEKHANDKPVEESARRIIEMLLPATTDRSDFTNERLNRETQLVRFVPAIVDDYGVVIRERIMRSFNPAIFIDMAYVNIDDIEHDYPSLFHNSSPSMRDHKTLNDYCRDYASLQSHELYERRLNECDEMNSIIWSRAIDFDDLIECEKILKEGVNDDILTALEDVLEYDRIAFHRIVASISSNAVPSEDDYNAVIESMKVFNDGCAPGVMHFTVDSLIMMMYGAITFGKPEIAGIYAALISFLRKYKKDDNARHIGQMITFKNGDMNSDFLSTIHDFPYEFTREQFGVLLSQLNNVSTGE